MLSFCEHHVLIRKPNRAGKVEAAHLDGLLALEHFCHDVAELVEVGESSSVSL